MTSTIALLALAFIPPPPMPADQGTAMRLLLGDFTPSEFAVNPLAQLLGRPASLLEAVREAMKRLKPGMSPQEVDSLLSIDSLKWHIMSGSSFGNTYHYQVGNNHTLRVRFKHSDDPAPGFTWAVLYRDGEVDEQVGEVTRFPFFVGPLAGLN